MLQFRVAMTPNFPAAGMRDPVRGSVVRPPPDDASKAAGTLRRLRIDIVSGQLAPGAKLSFGPLTARYRVGLSPLREALCQLVGGGLVTLESQRGFRVAAVSPAELADLVAVRRHIEVHAFGLSIRQGDTAWRAQLQAATARFAHVAAKAGDRRPIDEDWQQLHRAFHFALIGACRSPMLLQFCQQIYDCFDRYRRLAVPAQSFMAGPARDHHELTAAALSGDDARGQLLLQRHLDDIAEVVVANFNPPEES